MRSGNWLGIVAMATALFTGGTAGASLIAYEGFDYSAGNVAGNVNGTTGTTWVNSGAAGAFNQVVAPGLSGPVGLPAAAGNTSSVAGNVGTRSDKLDFNATNTGVTSGTVWYSLLLNVPAGGLDNQGAASLATGSYAFALTSQPNGTQASAPAAAQVVAKIQIRRDESQRDGATYKDTTNTTAPESATLFNIGTANTNVPAATGGQWATQALSTGATQFLLISYTFGADAASDVTNVWINPSAASFDPLLTPDATYTGSGFTSANRTAGVKAIFLRQTGGLPTSTLIDEIRVGTEYTDVINLPEPAGVMTLGALAALTLGRRRA